MDKQLLSTPKSFRLLKVLAETERSSIFKALWEDSSGEFCDQCVLKVLKSKKLVSECVDEFCSLKTVQSPYCVRVYSWEWVDGCPALVLEYLDGVNLAELCAAVELDDFEVQFIIYCVYQGLKSLQEKGIVHGDLSPHNIMLTQEGQVKLIDYGLANIGLNQQKFTPGYVAPEILNGGHYSHFSDLYALGQVALWLGASRKKVSSLLSHIQNKRKMPSLKIKAGVRQGLAKKVVRAQQFSEREVVKTQLLHQEKWQKLQYSALMKVVSASLLCCFFVGSRSVQGQSYAHHSWLSFNSNRWYKIKINGHSLGYTPIFQHQVSPGRVEVRWETDHQQGARTLTVQPGEHKVLSEKDLRKN